MSAFTELIELSAERLGGRVVEANDEFFAPKENLLKREHPVFIEGKYTEHGKWMDGWETRRRREPGHDWCLVRLGLPGRIRGVNVDTTHFRGNQPDSCSIDAVEVAEPEDLPGPDAWDEILPRTPLQPDISNLFPIASERRYTHVRLNIYPDGGVARLRVFGDVRPDWARLERADASVDLIAIENGGRVGSVSDGSFGEPYHLLLPGRGRDMGDGWETRRRRGPGNDWVVIQLSRRGVVERVEVDTRHFKGNYPDRCSLEGCDASGLSREPRTDTVKWVELLPPQKLAGDTLHTFEAELGEPRAVTHVRFNIYPDGGVSRLRLWGRLDPTR